MSATFGEVAEAARRPLGGLCLQGLLPITAHADGIMIRHVNYPAETKTDFFSTMLKERKKVEIIPSYGMKNVIKLSIVRYIK